MRTIKKYKFIRNTIADGIRFQQGETFDCICEKDTLSSRLFFKLLIPPSYKPTERFGSLEEYISRVRDKDILERYFGYRCWAVRNFELVPAEINIKSFGELV